MSELSKGGNGSDVVSVSGKDVSIQLLQDVYHSLTGKTEHLQRFFFDPHVVKAEDFKNLHTLIQQALEQYYCLDLVDSFLVRYVGGRSERFSGFGRFSAQAFNRSLCVEEVQIDYDFLIHLPQSKEAKPYKISIRLRSTLATLQDARDRSASNSEIDMLLRFTQVTAHFEVQYVDIAVARALEAHFEDWYRSIAKVRSGFSRFCSKVSGFVDILIRVLSIFSAAIVLLVLFSGSVDGQEAQFSAIVASIAVLAVVRVATFPLGDIAERWLKGLSPQSSLLLSSADQDLVDARNKSVGVIVVKVFLNAFFSIGCGVAAALLGWWIGIGS
ncbi:hypothetical protein [Roseicyclus persicicus]|uniref:Uncharacterized protein n=1 Tax=Roseicyclus persicicus TaxID=2650661 RepID=A0A7X6GWB4_9RHOB|nr:hypothetical protein [Roseibacterium persicicum]NKX43503.1 hypothetical protein [Roseibacterium persicicum]